MAWPAKKQRGSNRSPSATKCSALAVMSIMCVLVTFANMVLTANLVLRDAPSGMAHEPSNLVTPLLRSAKQYGEGPLWKTSPHLVDCRKLAEELVSEEETGMFMPIHCPSAECVHSQFLMSIHNPLMDDVSYSIYKQGSFEGDHLLRMLDALSQYPNSYLVDIGGNIGMWSLPAAAANHSTYTIEPFPLNYRRLCKSINKNKFNDLVHLFSVAASSDETKFVIDVPKRNKGGGRVAAAKDVEGIEDTYRVDGVPIDSLGLPTDRPIVLKLDVEGHELQALMGAMSFLQRADIVYAMTELRPTFQKDDHTYNSWKEIIDILVEKGLQPYRIDYEKETKLDANKLQKWRHVKHPHVRYFDVIWKKD